MRFYDALQLDPAVLKPMIRSAETQNEKRRLFIAMALRAVLIVLFAMAFIVTISKPFGEENTPMAVALFCIFLSIRFVGFGYCIKESLCNFAVILSLLLVSPNIAVHVNPILAFIIHAVSFFIILLMSTDMPEMGNGGLYGFAYVYLTGNTVTGAAFWNRAELTLVGFIVCGFVFWLKNREKDKDLCFKDIVAKFNLADEKGRWQLRMAVGVGVVLSVSSWLNIPRFMWVAFAFASLLSTYPYKADVKEKVIYRIIGAVVGSVAFLIVASIIPANLHTVLGPIGGLCLGFCTDYRYKTAFNCFGALMMATSLYGVEGAVILRVADAIIGVIAGWAFIYIYGKVMDSIFYNIEECIEENMEI